MPTLRHLLTLVTALIPCLAAAGAPPVTVLRAGSPITVDGVIDEATWRDGAWTSGLRLLNRDVPAPWQTRFQLRYDDEQLYLAIVADEPEPESLVRAAVHRDGGVHRDDCVEIMLDPSGERVEYFHLVVNSAGVVYDAWMRQGGYVRSVEWNADVRAAATVGADHWSVELAIPLLDIGPFAAAGQDWALNVTRERRVGEAELSTYAPLSGDFHQPQEYAALRLPGADLSAYRWDLGQPVDERLVAAAGGGFRYLCRVQAGNRTGTAGTVRARAIVDGIAGDWTVSRLEDGDTAQLEISVDGVREGRRQRLRLELADATGAVRATTQVVRDLAYTSLVVRFLEPGYRDALYATQHLDALVVELRSDLPAAELAELRAVVRLGSATAHGPASAIDTLVVPLAERPTPGDHTLVASLVDAADRVVHRAADTLRVLPRVDDEWRLQDGVFLHNGEPVLPFGWFSIPAEHMAHDDHAFELMQSYGWYGSSVEDVRAFLDRVVAAGSAATIYPYPGGSFMSPASAWGRLLTDAEEEALRQRVRALKDHPGLFAWYMADEPELKPALPERCRQIYEIIADEDPYHPCLMLNDTVAGIYRYADAGDVLMPDPYPTFLADGLAAQPIEKVGHFIDAAVEAAAGWRGVWITPQGFNYGDYGRQNNRAPSFVEVRNQFYQAVVHGARGALWYTYSHSANYPSLGIGMRWLSFEVADLQAAILAPPAAGIDLGVDAAQAEHVHLSARRTGDGDLVLFAVNTATEAQDVAIELHPAPAVDSLWVVSEDRAVSLLTDGVLRDRFDVYETHIYTSDRGLAQRAPLALAQARIDSFEAARHKPGNVALETHGSQVEVSSRARYSSFPARVVDGVTDGMRWRDGSGGEWPDWLVLHWPTPQTVGRLVVYGNAATVRLEVPDADAWRPLSAEVVESGNHLLLHLDRAVTTDTVRLVVDGVRDDGAHTVVYEVEAYAR